MTGDPSVVSALKKEKRISSASKTELIERVSYELNVPRRTAARVIDVMLTSIKDLLREKNGVAVKDFGTFRVKDRKGRKYKHPTTGKTIDVPNKMVVLFRAAESLKSTIRKKQDR